MTFMVHRTVRREYYDDKAPRSTPFSTSHFLDTCSCYQQWSNSISITERSNPLAARGEPLSIVGPLLASPPERGRLRAELERLAQRSWEHPSGRGPVRFSVSTIERWYYQARAAHHDPVGALRRRVRTDSGRVRAMSVGLIAALRAQYRAVADDSARGGWRLDFETLTATGRAMPLHGTHRVGGVKTIDVPKSQVLAKDAQKGLGLQMAAIGAVMSARGTSIAVGNTIRTVWKMAGKPSLNGGYYRGRGFAANGPDRNAPACRRPKTVVVSTAPPPRRVFLRVNVDNQR